MFSRSFDVTRRIASRPALCYRALRTVTTTAASEGSTSGRPAGQPRLPQSQVTAFVKLKEHPKSLAEAYIILGALERKYGAIVETELFADPDFGERYRNVLYVVFKDKESLQRIPTEGEQLFVPAPSDLPSNPLNLRLSDLEATYKRADYDPFFNLPTSMPEENANKRFLEIEIQPSAYDKHAVRRGYTNPIPPRQILRAFGEWGGFSKLEPVENPQRIVMKQLFLDKPPVDNIHLRFALQSYRENVPGSVMASPDAPSSSSSSSKPFDVKSILSSAKQASKPSKPAAEPVIPLKDLSPPTSSTPAKEEATATFTVESTVSVSKHAKRQPSLSPEERASQQAALDRQIEMAKQLLQPRVSQASKQPKQNKPKIKVLKRSDLQEEESTVELDDIERLIKETERQQESEKKGILGSIMGLFSHGRLTFVPFFVRLYSKGRILGHKRAKRNSRPNTSLLQIEGVATKEEAQFYLGKRVAFVYKAKREIQGSKVRVIWGRVTRPHGSSGVVKSKFRANLPPRAFGASVRVMLYPSTI
ncbi:hypothetical protein CVT24_005988 [Panaeolus cyanescens]|uniref:Ribosomal protein L35Ae n=1 Tax=Panaeolus cyanescens TaxID=181874 RepID=A0A409V8W1_9AGAR|nr:hypothetical protein CVT24_005988 [Panaeolus cyanescens]